MKNELIGKHITFINIPIVGYSLDIRSGVVKYAGCENLLRDASTFVVNYDMKNLKRGFYFTNFHISKLINYYFKNFEYDDIVNTNVITTHNNFLTMSNFILSKNDNIEIITDFICRLNIQLSNSYCSYIIIKNYFR